MNRIKNMGTADRIIRELIAIILTFLYFTNVLTGTWGIVLVIISVIFVLTSIIGFCPLYFPFGIRTKTKKQVV